MEPILKLSKLIKNKRAKIGIVGMGYVGQALAGGTVGAGFTTLGFDIDKEKIATIKNLGVKKISATEDTSKLADCDIINICIPTPIDQAKKPDLSILEDVSFQISKYLHIGQLIIIESSIAPGTTRNFVLPILQKSKLKGGLDFFLGFSPERIDPANSKFGLKNTPKVVGGLEENSKKLAIEFYSQFVEEVVPVSSLEVAEMTKVFENVFRLVNISLVNEIAEYTKAIGINIWEVIDAASTKPFGFLAHYPGPGVGGHCIPVLPYHLLDSAKIQDIKLRVAEAAAIVNELQPEIVVRKAVETINGKLKKNGENPKVLLIGVSYKPETSDIRESPALKIWQLLAKKGLLVSYHDPYVSNINGFSSQKLTRKVLSDHDLVIVTTAHKNIPYKKLLAAGKPIIDTRNILRDFAGSNILRV